MPNCARPTVVIAALAIVNSSKPQANRSASRLRAPSRRVTNRQQTPAPKTTAPIPTPIAAPPYNRPELKKDRKNSSTAAADVEVIDQPWPGAAGASSQGRRTTNTYVATHT